MGKIIFAYPPKIFPKNNLNIIYDPNILFITDWDTRYRHLPNLYQTTNIEHKYLSAIKQIQSISTNEDLIIPISEEAIIPIGKIEQKHGFTKKQCILTSDRKTQREALKVMSPHYLVNEYPNWDLESYILKAPISVKNDGVMKMHRDDDINIGIDYIKFMTEHYVERAFDCLGLNLEYYLVEEFIEGEQYEVSGINGDDPENPIKIFNVLKQNWDFDSNQILSYDIVYDKIKYDIINIGLEAVSQLGLKWCAWNVEIRGKKVIEVNGRLGEDGKGYYGLLDDGNNPYTYLINKLSKRWLCG